MWYNMKKLLLDSLADNRNDKHCNSACDESCCTLHKAKIDRHHSSLLFRKLENCRNKELDNKHIECQELTTLQIMQSGFLRSFGRRPQIRTRTMLPTAIAGTRGRSAGPMPNIFAKNGESAATVRPEGKPHMIVEMMSTRFTQEPVMIWLLSAAVAP